MEILERLEAVNEDVNWKPITTDIEDFVGAYNLARANSEPEPENYLQDILPDYWQVVHTHNTHRWVCEKGDRHPSEFGYDVGIFLVGYSILPIVLSLAEIQPGEKIYFLHSTRTEPQCDEITDRIREMMVDPSLYSLDPLIDAADRAKLLDRVTHAKRLEIADSSNPVETFRLIKEIINDVRDKFGKNKRIALDLTGGKKTMIGGGFTAGSIWSQSPDCDMFYVDSEDYDIAPGAPIPGTEFLNRLENPYDVYNVQTVQSAKELFSKHNYDAAADLWKGIKKKLKPHYTQLGLKTEYDEAVKHYSRADCYHHWDAFYYQEAKDKKDSHGNSWEYDLKHKHRSIDVLNILAAVRNRATLFGNDAQIIHYAVDRYQNAIRRKKTGKLEDAIVRFTQVVEMLCNYRVYGNLLDSDSKQVEIPPDTPWALTPLIRFLFRVGNLEYSYHTFLWNHNCDRLLDINDYSYTVKEITSLIEFRNDFIHVNSSMRQQETEENTEKLQNLALEFLRKFSRDRCQRHNLDFNRLLELHEFQKE